MIKIVQLYFTTAIIELLHQLLYFIASAPNFPTAFTPILINSSMLRLTYPCILSSTIPLQYPGQDRPC